MGRAGRDKWVATAMAEGRSGGQRMVSTSEGPQGGPELRRGLEVTAKIWILV